MRSRRWKRPSLTTNQKKLVNAQLQRELALCHLARPFLYLLLCCTRASITSRPFFISCPSEQPLRCKQQHHNACAAAAAAQPPAPPDGRLHCVLVPQVTAAVRETAMPQVHKGWEGRGEGGRGEGGRGGGYRAERGAQARASLMGTRLSSSV